jgi:serine protease
MLSSKRVIASLSLVLSLLFSSLIADAQPVVVTPDPLALPVARPASKGAYQWGAEMLRMDAAWALTKGRAHLSIVDGGFANHPELAPGLDGNYRAHLSQLDPAITNREQASYFHGLMTAGVMAARGFNGTGISGACPWCSVTYHEYNSNIGFEGGVAKAIASGASVLNISLGGAAEAGGTTPRNCQTPPLISELECSTMRRTAERDMLVVSIAQNQANKGGGGAPTSDGIPFPANYPSVIAVGGLESDGTFWTRGYDVGNVGSNWGPKIRLVAPARDILTLTNRGKTLYNDATTRCGDRIDSALGQGPTLPESYAGYGDCTGTSFSAPAVAGIAGLMRSANPLLTAPEIQTILYETATRPVAGPAGSGLTFYVPDAAKAVQRALGKNATNRITPVFSLFAADTQTHLFTSSPQMAVAAVAAEVGPTAFQSVGSTISGYPKFSGKLCDSGGNNCVQPKARSHFKVYTTETSPIAGRDLVPLYRMTQVCAAGSAGCKSSRAFAYAAGRAQALAFEAKGYVVDVVEGYVFGAEGSQPSPVNTLPLCLGFDSARIDYILYANQSCNQTQLGDEGGATTGGNYQSVLIGYAPANAAAIVDYTDMWWVGESQNGWGVSISQHGLDQFIVIYAYDASGKPVWYVMSGGSWIPQQVAYTGALYQPTSSPFSNYNAAAFSVNAAVGSATVTYSSSSTAELSYTINGITGTKTIKRQVFGAEDEPAPLQVGDLWWGGEAQNGWGLNITQQGRTLFPVWYTYDAAGKVTWYMVPGGVWTGTSFTGDLYSTTGSPWLGRTYDPAILAVTKVGAMTLNFTNQSAATMTYTANGVTQSKSISRLISVPL